MFDAILAVNDVATTLSSSVPAAPAANSDNNILIPKEWIYGAFVCMGLAVISMAADQKNTNKRSLEKLDEANNVINDLRDTIQNRDDEIRNLESEKHSLQADIELMEYKYNSIKSKSGSAEK